MTRRDRTATPCTSARPGPRRRRRRKSRSRSAAGPSRPRSEGDGGFRAESSGGFPRPPSGRSRRPAVSILLRERRGIRPGAHRANPPRRRQREAGPRHGLPGPMLLEPACRRFDLSTVQRVSRSCPAPYQAPEGKSIFRRVRGVSVRTSRHGSLRRGDARVAPTQDGEFPSCLCARSLRCLDPVERSKCGEGSIPFKGSMCLSSFPFFPMNA